MTTDAERLMQAKRTLGGMTSALNRARQHERDMFQLLAEMYAELGEDSKQKFKDRYEAEAAKARKGR